jgi:Ca-activated chloride channel family protein
MGNQYYGQTADDLMDPFREELALLEALCARNPRLMLKPAAGIGMKVLNNYPVTAEGHVRLPALAYDGEAWALLRLTVPAGLSVTAAPLVVAQLAYTTLDGDECVTGNQTLNLPRVPAAAYGAIAEDELVARRSAEVAVAQLQVRARSAAQQHQWNEVDALLKQSQKIAKDNPWASSVIEELSQLAARRDSAMYAKEAAYSSRRMCARLAPQEESAELSISDEPMFLRRKSAQGKQAPKP